VDNAALSRLTLAFEQGSQVTDGTGARFGRIRATSRLQTQPDGSACLHKRCPVVVAMAGHGDLGIGSTDASKTAGSIWRPAAPSIFFGQHDRNDAPRDGRVSRIGGVVRKILVVVVDLE
jgi:hypothetical protein